MRARGAAASPASAPPCLQPLIGALARCGCLGAGGPGASWRLRAAFLAGLLLGAYVLYSCSTSALYRRDSWGRATAATEPAVEALVWASLMAAAASYLFVQGSSPGYLARGESPAAGAPDDVAAAVAALTAAAPLPVSAPKDVAVELDAPRSPAPRSPAATAGAAAAPLSLSVPPLQTLPPLPPLERDRDRDLRALAVEAADTAGVSELLGEPADFDFDSGSDPAHSAAAEATAAAAAQRGWRECRWCAAQQTRRAHHCRVCDRCVATFDHHCVALGTCVGERNRARFWLFLLCQSVAQSVAIGLLNTAYVWRRTYSDWLSANAGPLVAELVLWPLQLLVLGLLGFHSWLAMTNTTTFETATGAARLWYLAGSQPKNCDLPFSRGLCGNLRAFCCRLDTCGRDRVEPGDAAHAQLQAQAHAQGRAEATWNPFTWPAAQVINRDSDNICSNLWENRYWSCC